MKKLKLSMIDRYMTSSCLQLRFRPLHADFDFGSNRKSFLTKTISTLETVCKRAQDVSRDQKLFGKPAYILYWLFVLSIVSSYYIFCCIVLCFLIFVGIWIFISNFVLPWLTDMMKNDNFFRPFAVDWRMCLSYLFEKSMLFFIGQICEVFVCMWLFFRVQKSR